MEHWRKKPCLWNGGEAWRSSGVGERGKAALGGERGGGVPCLHRRAAGRAGRVGGLMGRYWEASGASRQGGGWGSGRAGGREGSGRAALGGERGGGAVGLHWRAGGRAGGAGGVVGRHLRAGGRAGGLRNVAGSVSGGRQGASVA